jgi:hypothetical protein
MLMVGLGALLNIFHEICEYIFKTKELECYFSSEF